MAVVILRSLPMGVTLGCFCHVHPNSFELGKMKPFRQKKLQVDVMWVYINVNAAASKNKVKKLVG